MKKIVILILVLLMAIGFRFKFGVYQHDEFVWENHLFIKHRLIWKWKFYSPQGMSDLPLEGLLEQKRVEQGLFNEFVREQGLSR